MAAAPGWPGVGARHPGGVSGGPAILCFGLVSHASQKRLPLGPLETGFEVPECDRDDVAMMHAQAARSNALQPEAVNKLDIVRAQVGRMRPQMQYVTCAVRSVHHGAHLQIGIFGGPLPRLAQEPDLLARGHLGRLAERDFR